MKKYLTVSRGPGGYRIAIEVDGVEAASLMLSESEAVRVYDMIQAAKNSGYTDSRQVIHALGVNLKDAGCPPTPATKSSKK